MKTKFLLLINALLIVQSSLSSLQTLPEESTENNIVTSTKRLLIKDFYGAHNPSIVKYKDGYLMSFRWTPNHWDEPWISYICLVLLNSSFDPISTVDVLDTRKYNNITPSQSEDARIFYFKDKLYVVYNDNMDLVFPSTWERRDMYIAEIVCDENNTFTALEPLRFVHSTKYRDRPWQKNWNPFVWNDRLLFSYNLHPHEVILADLANGICQPIYETKPKTLDWKFGELQGAAPAYLVDGEYLAFFHSKLYTKSPCSENQELYHYFMGAYTFSADPPFTITKISQEIIDSPEFYTYSSYLKRVIYPGGFVVNGPNLYLAYGKDDCEIWIATIDLEKLKKSLIEVK
jgi:predicted GH43/DUF377 family glycosyl hydrolase